MAPLIKKCIEEFIEIYRNEPCLWQINCKDYKDAAKKKVAYAKLVEKLREIDPQANRESVVRKINGLRTTYRKELRKVNQSLNTGTEHEPKLFYFDALNFLYEQDSIRSPQSRRVKKEKSSVKTINKKPNSKKITTIQQKENCEELYEKFEEELLNGIEEEELDVRQVTARVAKQHSSTYKQHQRAITPEKILFLKDDTIEQRSNFDNCTENIFITEDSEQPKFIKYSKDDRFDIFGKHIAIKLRDLPKQQSLIAEKLMNETLFAAEMGLLNLSYKVGTNRDIRIYGKRKARSRTMENEPEFDYLSNEEQ